VVFEVANMLVEVLWRPVPLAGSARLTARLIGGPVFISSLPAGESDPAVTQDCHGATNDSESIKERRALKRAGKIDCTGFLFHDGSRRHFGCGLR
jgi:hypothetical protein